MRSLVAAPAGSVSEPGAGWTWSRCDIVSPKRRRSSRCQIHAGVEGLKMSGNASYRLANTAVLSVGAVEAPIVVTLGGFDDRLAETYERLGMRSRDAGGAGRRPRAPLVAGGRLVRRRGRDGRGQGAGRGRHHPGADRRDDQHLGVPGLPRAVDRGRGAPPARAADQLPQLRPGQRLPGLRQRHPAGRHHDRRRPGRLRPAGRRRGLPVHPGGHAGPAGRAGRDRRRTSGPSSPP